MDACAELDLTTLSDEELAALVIDLRGAATKLEVAIARLVHCADQAELWKTSGATSMDVWLADATNSTVRSARDQVQLANTLAAAPLVAEKMSDGGLSVDNVRLLASVVHHEAFEDYAAALVEVAGGAPRQTKRELERWLAVVDTGGETDRDEALRLKRHLCFTPNGHGMVDVKGMLTLEDAAHVQTALQHIAGAAYADETGRPHHTRLADALTDLCKAYNAGEVNGGRERPKLLVTVPFETIAERASARGVVVGSDATLSGEAVRRLACDAELHRIVTKGASVVLDFGSSTRLASDNQFLAMAARDGGCRWPGCDRPPGWCEAHHIDEVIRDDGPTNLRNMALFCSTHHHLLHSREWQLVGDAHNLSIEKPNGTRMPAPPRGHLANAQQPALELVG